MIKNLWQNTSFYCMRHEKPVEMVFREGKKELFYACPKYDPNNRADDERGCRNNMYTQDAEAAVNHISDLIEEYEQKGLTADAIVGAEWTKRDIDFKVLSYENGRVKVSVLNRSSLAMAR